MTSPDTATGFHPDLLPLARLLPRFSFTERKLRMLRRLTALRGMPKVPVLDDVAVEDLSAPGPDGAPDVPLRLYRPRAATEPVPALVWVHGGGFIIGDAYQDQRVNLALVRELGIAVASVDYRLAPEHPFPAPIEDGYAALRWVHAEAGTLGLRPDRLAIGGASAGGGLAAGLALMAADHAEVSLAFQLLIYPMLDDRTVARTDVHESRLRLWSTRSNHFGWRSYLGGEPGGEATDPCAAPARRDDLPGLPPAWIGVGTCDLFHDEDVAYAERLIEAGIPCDLHVAPGAYHAFDRVQARAGVSREFRRRYVAALRTALLDAPG